MGETSVAYNRRKRYFFFDKYIHGKGIDIGCFDDKLVSDCDGYEAVDDGSNHANLFGDATYCGDIASETYDWVYSSHCLEDIEMVDVAIQNWWRILKYGGYLILLLPHRDYFEQQRELPSKHNQGHKHYFLPFISEPPVTISLYDLILKNCPNAQIIDIHECTEGCWFNVNENATKHLPMEYSIEAIIQKGVYTPFWEKNE